MRRIVVALGGNALLKRDEELTPSTQQRNIEHACDAVARLAAGNELVVVHGSGPQVGMLALRVESSSGWKEPLDVLGAEIEGMLGYMIQRELHGRLDGRPVVSLLTQVVVDRGDPAFGEPTKPIGRFYAAEEVERLRAERGWELAEEPQGWRRVVPSPEPRRLLEIESVRTLVDAGHVVVAAGGGGVPVMADGQGRLEGVEAVVDKDLSAALLAEGVGADVLLLLTDARAIYRDRPEAADPIMETTPERLRALDLPAGSMGPKAEAAARFVERTGGRASIGAMEEAQAVLEGRAGTHVVRG